MKKVMIYFSDNMLYQPVLEFVKQYAPLRYKYAIQFYQKKDQYNVAMAYLLTCMAKGCPVGELSYQKNGKPSFFNSTKYGHFSITHTNNLVAIVTANQNVGIDSESCFDVDNEIINNVSSTNEKSQIKNNPFLKTLFWTAKESLSKLLNEDWYSASYTDLIYTTNKLFDKKNDSIHFEYYEFRENIICITSKSNTYNEINLIKNSDIMKFIMNV